MANVAATARVRSRNKTVPKSTPYNPLASSYKTNQQFNQAVNQSAQSQIQPQLNNLDRTQGQDISASTGRQSDISGWYGWEADQLAKAFNDTSGALNNLIATRQAGSADAQQNLAAALRGYGTSDLAARLGATAPANDDASILSAALGSANTENNANFGTAAAMTSGLGERRALAPVGAIQAHTSENKRLDALLTDIGNQRSDIYGQLPGLRQQARQQLSQEELAKEDQRLKTATEAYQEQLGSKEFGLKQRTENFQENLAQQNLQLNKRKQGHQEAIDWANIGLNKEQIQAQLAKIQADVQTAGTKQQKADAQLRAKQWNNALSLLDSYMKPAAGEAPRGVNAVDAHGNPVMDPNSGKRIYSKYNFNYKPRDYYHAYQLLTSKAGLSNRDALIMLSQSDIQDWRVRAEADLQGHKRKSQLPYGGRT